MMSIHNTADSFWFAALNHLYRKESIPGRLCEMKEQIGYYSVLTRPENNIVYNRARRFSLSYSCAEMLWYLGGTDSIEMIKAYAPSYGKYAENGIAYGAYGKRISSGDQLNYIIKILLQDPHSRQAILTLFRWEDLPVIYQKATKDVPCTLSLQFRLVNNILHLVATMRSNDAWLGLPNDIFCFTTLQSIVASVLGIYCGVYIHQAGSMHIHSTDYEKTKRAIELGPEDIAIQEGPMLVRIKDLQKEICRALELEEEGRNLCFDLEALQALHPIFHDLVLGSWLRWGCEYIQFNNKIYQHYLGRSKAENEKRSTKNKRI